MAIITCKKFLCPKNIFFCIITVSQLYSILVFFRFIAYSGCISLHSPLFMTRQQIVKRNTWKVRLRKRRRKCWQSVVCKISCVDEKRVVHELDNSNHLCYLVRLSQVYKYYLILWKKLHLISRFLYGDVKTILRCHYKMYLSPSGIISLKSLHWYAPCWETFTR